MWEITPYWPCPLRPAEAPRLKRHPLSQFQLEIVVFGETIGMKLRDSRR